jgi:hypothetical protein
MRSARKPRKVEEYAKGSRIRSVRIAPELSATPWEPIPSEADIDSQHRRGITINLAHVEYETAVRLPTSFQLLLTPDRRAA